MVYIPNTDAERADMLKVIGVKNFEELISNIPPSLRVKGDLKLPESMSEFEVVKHMRSLSAKNATVNTHSNYIGGGAYDHFIPAIIDSVLSRPEFYTAYTPYQAELSQGTLQVMYEFQTCVSMLAGLDISNASLYDGASAIAEAVLMANSINKKNKILLAETLHPNYKQVIKTYCQGSDIVFEEVKAVDGTIDLADLKARIDENVSALVLQHPNFFGCLEETEEIKSIISQNPGILFIVSYNPLTVGLLKSPGDYGADIAVAEGQPLGINLNFGGPYLGLLSTKNEFIRKMPGRMAGKTIDPNGKDGFVLALQTREQHIKREKATSNICTNEGLMTVAALTYMCYMGKEGMHEVASQCYNKAHYLAEKISALNGYSLMYTKPFFHEFVIKTPKSAEAILKQLLDHKILGGVDLKKFGYDGLMVAVTEKRTREELDEFVNLLTKI